MLQASSFKLQDKAFTLLELLIVIGIISIMSAIVFAGAGNRRQKFALQRSVYKIGQNIRRASEMGMSARDFRGSVPEGGYGIHFDTATSSYILFADLGPNPDHIYTSSDEEVEKIKLEKGVEITSLSPDAPLDITFKPPNPIITITSGGATTTEASVTISLKTNPSNTRAVHVNKAGLIDID